MEEDNNTKRKWDSGQVLNRWFGNKFYILMIFACIGFLYIMGSLSNSKLKNDDKEKFLLDSDSKYLVSIEAPINVQDYYYEVDLSSGEVTKRNDNEEYKRVEVKKINTNIEELEEILKNITSDDKNKEITDQEKQEIFSHRCFWIFKVTDSSNNSYYTKDIEQINELKSLLGE